MTLTIDTDHLKTTAATVVSFLTASGVIDVGQGKLIDGVVTGALVIFAAVQTFRRPKVT